MRANQILIPLLIALYIIVGIVNYSSYIDPTPDLMLGSIIATVSLVCAFTSLVCVESRLDVYKAIRQKNNT